MQLAYRRRKLMLLFFEMQVIITCKFIVSDCGLLVPVSRK